MLGNKAHGVMFIDWRFGSGQINISMSSERAVNDQRILLVPRQTSAIWQM